MHSEAAESDVWHVLQFALLVTSINGIALPELQNRSLSGGNRMLVWTRVWSLIIVAALCSVAGCGKDEPPLPAGGSAPAAGDAAARQGPADSADKAVLAAIEGLTEPAV